MSEELEVVSAPLKTSQIETKKETMQMMLASLTETENTPRLTTEQVTALIEQRSKVHEFVHEDKKISMICRC